MLSGVCGWGGISIELGEKRTVQSIPGVAEKFRRCKLPMSAALLGYEYFYQSALPAEESIFRAIVRTLAETGVPPAEVDMVLISSADAGFLADRQLLPALLCRLGSGSALPLSITSQECTGLLSAIDLACTLVRDRSLRNIVVVSYDRAADDDARIQPFGVVSDAVVACLVSSMGRMDFVVKAFSHVADLRGMQGDDDFATRKSLTERGTNELLTRSGTSLARVKKVFTTNFFRPVAKYNASTLGLSEQQLDMGYALEFGHCLCADPLLNLWSYSDSASDCRKGDLFLLQAYAPGFLASMLIERATERIPRSAHPAADVADADDPGAVAIEQAW